MFIISQSSAAMRTSSRVSGRSTRGAQVAIAPVEEQRTGAEELLTVLAPGVDRRLRDGLRAFRVACVLFDDPEEAVRGQTTVKVVG